jgi:lipopolysaccharide export system ATP-binding protein
LDEPFSGIDPIVVNEAQDIIKELKEKGLGILLTDHNVRETLSICNRAYIMCDGKILKSGTSEFLANDPEARKIYLGEKFRLNCDYGGWSAAQAERFLEFARIAFDSEIDLSPFRS